MFYFDTVGHGLWFDATGGATGDITLVAGFQTGTPTAATIRVV
jgi:hypothetical protein